MNTPLRFLPMTVLILACVWIVYSAILPRDAQDKMNVQEFGRLPVVFGGRVKPFDTLARNSLTVIADQDTFTDSRYIEKPDQAYLDEAKDKDYDPAPTIRSGGSGRPAIEWFLDVISSNPYANKHPIFRIQNPEVLNILSLKRRKGYRYSFEEIAPKYPNLARAATEARARVNAKAARAAEGAPANRSESRDSQVADEQTLKLMNHIIFYIQLRESFGTPILRSQAIQQDLRREMDQMQQLEMGELPHAIPPAKGGKEWTVFRKAMLMAYIRTPERPLEHMNAILDARKREGEMDFNAVEAFNKEVAQYKVWLEANPPQGMDKLAFETFYNHLHPFYMAAVLSLMAFLLGAAGWLAFPTYFMRAAHFLMMAVFGLATFGITARVLISGYPPITNLYGTAIFIGWAAILTGLILEYYKPLGYGNLVGSTVGFITLLVAHFLAGGGDTMEMMQAVLDTKFWLATHVIIINLGYTATYFAGFMGILYVIKGVFTKRLDKETAKTIYRMTYGIICFGLLFSFVGTVLGGLWADDSWGRFWGWDPKENGALMIVLWNALILHARWGGMVQARGTAILAIFGNIVTSWSHFAVNQLGVGLHSYGKTDTVTYWLTVFFIVNFVFMVIGMLPRAMWSSYGDAPPPPPAPEPTPKNPRTPAAPAAAR